MIQSLSNSTLLTKVKSNNSQLDINNISEHQIYKIQQNIMIKTIFPIKFYNKIWNEIKKYKPQQFLQQQERIFEILIKFNTQLYMLAKSPLNTSKNNQELSPQSPTSIFPSSVSLFKFFYQNHQRLYQWYSLSSQKHQQMKFYIFKSLLKKKFQQYKEEIKENCLFNCNKENDNHRLSDIKENKNNKWFKKNNNSKMIQCNKSSNFMTRSQIFPNQNQQNQQNSFSNLSNVISITSSKSPSNHNDPIITVNTTNTSPIKRLLRKKASPHNKSNMMSKSLATSNNNSIYCQTAQMSLNFNKSSLNLNCKQQEDYHDLFVKTLDACDGSKYIYYDFGKHQKGYENRKSYNKFIRTSNFNYHNLKNKHHKKQFSKLQELRKICRKNNDSSKSKTFTVFGKKQCWQQQQQQINQNTSQQKDKDNIKIKINNKPEHEKSFSNNNNSNIINSCSNNNSFISSQYNLKNCCMFQNDINEQFDKKDFTPSKTLSSSILATNNYYDRFPFSSYKKSFNQNHLKLNKYINKKYSKQLLVLKQMPHKFGKQKYLLQIVERQKKNSEKLQQITK